MRPKAVAIGMALVLVTLVVSAHAETITRCSGSSGKGWYFESALTAKDEAGWRDDATQGEMLLNLHSNGPDIVWTDAGGAYSSVAKGAKATLISGASPGFQLVVLVYPKGAIEHFLFKLDGDGNGVVAWGMSTAEQN